MLLMANILAGVNEYLFFFLPAAGSMLLVYGIYQVVVESRHGDRRKVLDRLQGTKSTRTNADKPSILRRGVSREDAQDIFSGAVGKLSFIPKLQTSLDQANLEWSAERMMVNLGGAAFAALTVLLLLKINFIVAIGCAAAVIALPLMWISIRRKRRMAKLTEQLPDVFELMSQALRAGHSLASAIQLIHEQMPDPVASEFGRVFHEQNLGIKIEDALLAMADRVESLDVRFFVTAVLIQRQTGGDLAEVLDKIGGVIRERIELFGLVRGLTAEGRLSGWVLFGLPFVVFGAVMYMNPDYAQQLLTEPRGKIMLIVASGMQLMGLAMIRWIVNIKV
ncbi:MAG: type II secretion system F family protein [bacterium]|nr:type II secretion system F family protein [bacterium]